MRPCARHGSVRDEGEMRDAAALGSTSHPCSESRAGGGAAGSPQPSHSARGQAGVQVSTGQQGRSRLVLPRKALPVLLLPFSTWQMPVPPLRKIPPVLLECRSLSAGAGGPVVLTLLAARGCAMPAGEPAGCVGEESRFCALQRHRPAEPQNPALVSSGSVGRALETGDSQGSDAVWFASPLI